MPLDRRTFLRLAATGATLGMVSGASPTLAAPTGKIKALVFDGFAVFDPRPVFALADKLFPGNGVALSNAWRARQFEYQWLRALAGRYVDFWQATEDALVFAANLLKLELTPGKRRTLMGAYLQLDAWPDVSSALAALQNAGLRLALLSNATPGILAAGLENARLQGTFEQVLSTDARGTYKPDPRAYRMATDAFGLPRKEIGFVAFAGWDVAGAKWFGYPTFWVNRMEAPSEELDAVPDAMGRTLTDLIGAMSA